MEMYKSINRALSIQNQELRQQVAQLKEEIVYLNRTLMSAREESEMLRRTVLRCVSKASSAMSQIVLEIQSNNQIENDVSVAETQQENSFPSGRLSEMATQRSIQPVALTLRETLDRSDCDKENRVPSLDDEESVERISYVQMRRRRPPDNTSASTAVESTISRRTCDIDDATVDENENEDSEKSRDDPENRILRTIVEENTITNSYASNTLSVPFITRTLVNNRTRDQNSLIIEDTTTFDNFSALKATSSTPYKKPKENHSLEHMRSAHVVIRRLKGYEKQSATANRNEKSDRFVNSSARILTERSTNISNENNARPKRKAAPINFKEPSLNKKLRRKK